MSLSSQLMKQCATKFRFPFISAVLPSLSSMFNTRLLPFKILQNYAIINCRPDCLTIQELNSGIRRKFPKNRMVFLDVGGLLGARTLSNISTVAIIPSNDSVPLNYFTSELLWCLNAIGPTICLTNSDIANKFGEITPDSLVI